MINTCRFSPIFITISLLLFCILVNCHCIFFLMVKNHTTFNLIIIFRRTFIKMFNIQPYGLIIQKVLIIKKFGSIFFLITFRKLLLLVKEYIILIISHITSLTNIINPLKNRSRVPLNLIIEIILLFSY